MEKRGTARHAADDNIIDSMGSACWITKVTDTHSEHVIFIVYPQPQWLHKHDHMVGHPRCVFINYIWLNQLSNTTNLWWIDVYYIVINYMFRCLWPSSG